MEHLLELIASRQPQGVDVKCEMSTKGHVVRADVHYHTKGWVVSKVYQIVIQPPVVAIILHSFNIDPDVT